LKDMLSLPRQGPLYLILDALDECPNTSGMTSAREEVLELVEELLDLHLPNVHLCVTSRPEIDIRTVLEPLASFQISLHDERTKGGPTQLYQVCCTFRPEDAEVERGGPEFGHHYPLREGGHFVIVTYPIT